MYYRLVFRSSDRITGSSYGQPKFYITLPTNTFGNYKNCRVVFEAFDGYFLKPTKAYNSIILGFKEYVFDNEIQTISENNFANSGSICCISVADKIGGDYFYHEIDNTIFKDKGLEMTTQAFNNSIIQFTLNHLDGSVGQLPSSTDLQFYAFAIGIFVDE